VEISRIRINAFQFLLVRLKESFSQELSVEIEISIPSGAIKSLVRRVLPFISEIISIPSGAIKRV